MGRHNFDDGPTQLICWGDTTPMLGRRNFGWGDITWGDKAMGQHNLHVFSVMRRTWLYWHHCYSSVERPTEESRWLAVLECVAIFITYSLCIHGLFETFMINSLGKIMGSHWRCQYVLQLVGKFWTLSGLMGSIAYLENFILLIWRIRLQKELIRYPIWYIS